MSDKNRWEYKAEFAVHQDAGYHVRIDARELLIANDSWSAVMHHTYDAYTDHDLNVYNTDQVPMHVRQWLKRQRLKVLTGVIPDSYPFGFVPLNPITWTDRYLNVFGQLRFPTDAEFAIFRRIAGDSLMPLSHGTEGSE